MAFRAAMLVFALGVRGVREDNTACEVYSCYDTRGPSKIHVMIWVDALMFAVSLLGDRLCFECSLSDASLSVMCSWMLACSLPPLFGHGP